MSRIEIIKVETKKQMKAFIEFHYTLYKGNKYDAPNLFNDDMKAMAEEMVRTGKLDKIHIGTDYFDGSINRIGAWVIGQRATQKSLLRALLEPSEKLMSYENDGNYFARLALLEAEKTLPFGAVWNRYCEECSVPSDLQVIDEIMNYEKSVTALRG